MGLSLASDPSRSFLIIWALTGFIGGYVAGRVLGRMVAYGFLGRLLINRGVEFNVQPEHIDRAGGFKPFGDFFFFQAMLVALPALHLSLWSILIPLWPYNDYSRWLGVYLSLLPIVILFVIFSFVMPMLSVHTIMKRKKMWFLKIADEASREILELQQKLEQPKATEERRRIDDQLRVMTQRYHDIEKMATWPAGFNTIRLFGANSLALAFPLVIQLAKATGIWKEIAEKL